MNVRVRRILKVVLIISFVLVFLLMAVLLFLGPIIKTAVEKAGPLVLGVPIKVEKVSVDVLGGCFRLKNLRVGNPPGYSADPLAALGELRVAIDVSSLPGKGPVVIEEVVIVKPKFAYEVVNGVSNVDALKALLQKKLAGKIAAAQAAQAAQAASAVQVGLAKKKEARKVIIDRFECRAGEVSFRGGMTFGRAISLPLPSIVLTDIGRPSNGTSLLGAVQEMFAAIANAVGKTVLFVAGAVGDVGRAALDAGGVVGQAALDAGGAVGQAALDAGGTVGQAALDAGGAVGSTVGDVGKAALGGVQDAGSAVTNVGKSLLSAIGDLF